MNSLEDKVTSLLHKGSSNPVSSKYIAKLTGIDERMVRKTIERLVKAGEPIGSSLEGYYIITTPEELGLAIAHLLKRNKSVYERVNALKKLEENFSGQVRLEV